MLLSFQFCLFIKKNHKNKFNDTKWQFDRYLKIFRIYYYYKFSDQFTIWGFCSCDVFSFSFHSLSNFKWSNRYYGNELKMHLNQVFHYHAKRKIMNISWKKQNERNNRSKNNDINLFYSSSPIQFVCFSITIHVMRFSIQYPVKTHS